MVIELTEVEEIQKHLSEIEEAKRELNSSEALSAYLTSNNSFKNNLEALGASVQDEIHVTSVESNDVGVAGMTSKITIDGETEPITAYVKHYTPALPGFPKFEHKITPSERLERESEAIESIRALEIPHLVLPTVLASDPDKRYLITLEVNGTDDSEQIGPDSDTEEIAKVGTILGQIHTQTYDPNAKVSDEDVNIATQFLEFRLTGALQEYEEKDSEFTGSLQTFIEDAKKHMKCRTHGDLTPRNIRSLPNSDVAMFDFELSQQHGDPASDVGFYLGHFALEALKNPDNAAEINQKATEFWKAYGASWDNAPSFDSKEFESRVAKYTAATLFYRGWFTPSMPIDSEKHDSIFEKAQETFHSESIAEIFPQ